ncbi:MAG: SH3 domain-containing protein [Paracoccaceae bacterium]
MFVTLLVAGEDDGQMRPGLARAIASGEEIVMLERRRAPPVDPAAPQPAVAAEAPAEAVVIEQASYEPPAPVAPVRAPEPVFTLSTLPTVAMDPVQETVAAADEPPAAAPASGDVWYVTANTVNVREGPSTDTSVVDKLRRGEAVSVSFEPGSEWALVTIEGDGLQGYVALRFLSPEAP